MKGYYLKKVLSSLFVLFVIVSLNFFLPRMIFTDPAQPYFVGVPEDAIALREQIREEYGFNKPLVEQYFDYLSRVLTLDLGESHYYKESVWTVMFSRIPWSMVLTVSSLALSIFFGILLGAYAGRHRNKAADKVLLWLSGITTAIPSFWLAMVCVMLFGFALKLFPYRGAMTPGYTLVMNTPVFLGVLSAGLIVAIIGRLFFRKSVFVFAGIPLALVAALVASIPMADIIDVAYHATLPVLISAFSGVISYSLLVRNSMIAVNSEDYILTARAKGLPSHVVLYKHTFRNALLPLITNVGMSMAGLMGGSVLMEKIFSWPGMGQLLLEACNTGDYQLSQAILLLFAVITILCNFITDLVYHKFDPRVKEV